MKNKTKTMVKVFSFCIIAYAVGLKFIPENMPFSAQPAQDDFMPLMLGNVFLNWSFN